MSRRWTSTAIKNTAIPMLHVNKTIHSSYVNQYDIGDVSVVSITTCTLIITWIVVALFV